MAGLPWAGGSRYELAFAIANYMTVAIYLMILICACVILCDLGLFPLHPDDR
ncbi:11702_t:CDS:2 [Racocetra persica]|uniref:11702_t:CDS:1 n=2 Tax=Racocetra persica TaxID=160502 RepID=A0ACA9KDN5_9GLOM|nr:11701_t:CDS:2 [Racocetra persica]CAG8467873.1 11702_t:CDS:2 [Racocetra persica]